VFANKTGLRARILTIERGTADYGSMFLIVEHVGKERGGLGVSFLLRIG
jgi:hypothetical protein